MPYKSDKQRRFMHARHPDIASRWDQEIRDKKKVSKMQPRYGGAGTRGRRINDDDRPLGEVGKIDISRARGLQASFKAKGNEGASRRAYQVAARAGRAGKEQQQLMAGRSLSGMEESYRQGLTRAGRRRGFTEQDVQNQIQRRRVGKADLSYAERTERARAGRRTRRHGAGVAAAGLGTIGASEAHRALEAGRGPRNVITKVPGRPITLTQMTRIPMQVGSAHHIGRLGDSKLPLGSRLKNAGKDIAAIARHNPHGTAAWGGVGAIAAGDAMMIGGRARTAHHNAKMMEMRRNQAVASKRDDSRSGTQKTADRARAAAEIGGAGMVATSLAPKSVGQAQRIIRDTRRDTASIKGRPLAQQAKLRGGNALVDVMHRPRGAALIGSGALLVGAAPVAVGARLKARHDRKVGKLDEAGRRRARNATIGAAAGGGAATYGTAGLASAGVHAFENRRLENPARDDFTHGFHPKNVGSTVKEIAALPGGKGKLARVAGVGAAVGAGTGLLMARKKNKQIGKRYEVGKAERYYDPEHSRQRRIGAAEAGLALTGAAGLGEGGRRIYSDTKDLRKIKVRGPNRTPDTLLRSHPGASGAFRVRKLPAGLAVGGATALGGAGYLHRRASTRRGAAYR